MFVMIFLQWVPLLASATLLVVFWLTDDLSGRQQVVFGLWFLIAVWLQFFAGHRFATAGLVLQALLAVILALRARLR